MTCGIFAATEDAWFLFPGAGCCGRICVDGGGGAPVEETHCFVRLLT